MEVMAIKNSIRFAPEGKDRFRVLNPFPRRNGDHFCVIAKKDSDNRWIFTDEGDTLSEINHYYGSDIFKGKKRESFNSILEMYGVTNNKGELFLYHCDNENSLFALLQALISVEALAGF